MNNELIGKYLQELRQKHRLTQGHVASICNVSHQAVSHWENGKSLPDIESLKALSDYYKLSINDILDCKSMNEISKVKNEKENQIIGFSNHLLVPFITSISILVISLILILFGIINRVLPIMLLPALFITVFQSFYLFFILSKNLENERTYFKVHFVITCLTIISFIISILIFILNFNYLDIFGVIQPFIYGILSVIYCINTKPNKKDYQIIIRNKTEILYYLSLLFPLFVAFVSVFIEVNKDNILGEIYYNLFIVNLILFCIFTTLELLRKRNKLLIVMIGLITNVALTLFIIDNYFDLEILVSIFFILSILYNIYATIKIIKEK